MNLDAIVGAIGVTPYFRDEAVVIYHADCRDILPLMPKVDLVLTDPPWGSNTNTDSRRFTGGNRALRRGEGRDDWGHIEGDDEPFDPLPWLECAPAVLWGANHFAASLPVGTWLVWVKRAPHLYGSFLSDCELAWQSGGAGVYAYEEQFPPPSRMREGNGQCLHPTQKPLGLMKWCLERFPNAQTILDPFMGSGTTLRAAKDLGRYAIGIEIEERYCEIAAKRMAQMVMPLPLDRNGAGVLE